MVQKVITRVLRKRHYWRYMEFSELAELYASRVLRVTALSMISGFVAVLLYQTGYSLTFIAGYFTLQFIIRGLFAIPAAHIIGRIGPKHATLISNMTYVPAMLALSSVGSHGTAALAFTLVLQAIAASLYNIAYQVDFSKVKHQQHAGKEIGYMIALERIATALSPIIGGVIAYLFGPQTTVIVAALIFALAAWPLLLTAEPIRTHQHVTFSSLKWYKIERSLVANYGIGWDFAASGVTWSLFAAITIFGTGTDSVYAKLGIVTAVSVMMSVAMSRIYGILIDQKHGNDLLHGGVFGSSFINILRAFTTTPLGVLAVNIGNEAATIAYSMPFTKGVFDLADDLPGQRIAFLACMDMAICSGAAMAFLSLALLSTVFSEAMSLQCVFVFAAGMILLVTAHRLWALQPRYFVSPLKIKAETAQSR